MPDPSIQPPSPTNLSDRLDAYGRGLIQRESADAPGALLAAVRDRKQQIVIARIGAISAIAAAIALAAIGSMLLRPAPPKPTELVTPNGPVRPQPAQPAGSQAPTLAALRKLNRDGSPDSLRLPTVASGSVGAASSRPSDARNPDSVARLLGASPK